MTHLNYTLEERIKAETMSFSGKMSVYANDFHGNIVAVNADEPFEAASCIKSFILTNLFQQVNEGKKSLMEKLIFTQENFVDGSGVLQSLDLGTELSVKNLATLMIIVSDNIATNILIDYLGLDQINSTVRNLGLKDTELYNKLNFEKYSKLGTTTPREYGVLFEKLCNRELVSPEASDAMLAIYRQQHYSSMIVREFPQYYLDSEISGNEGLLFTASKSGSMNACRNDGGIVSTPYGSYVCAFFTKEFCDPLYYADHESSKFSAKVSRMLLDQYLALEGRFYL